MKSRGKIICLILCLLCLCGCGRQESGDKETGPEELRILRDQTLPELERDESLSMLCYMHVNRALLLRGKLYTLDYVGKDYRPVLARYETEGGLRREKILAEDCVPEFLCEHEGRLYYRNARRDGALESVGTDGADPKQLKERCDWLRLKEEKLYYCDGAGRFCSAELDGSGERVILEEPCDSPWKLEDALLYRRQADGCLRLYWEEDGSDIPLTERSAEAPVILDGRLYFTAGESLHSMDLEGLDGRRCALPPLSRPAELLPRGKEILLRGVSTETRARQWTAVLSDLENTLQYTAENGYRLCDWIGDTGRVDAVYNPDGRLRCFVYTDSAGGEHIYIAGRVSE